MYVRGLFLFAVICYISVGTNAVERVAVARLVSTTITGTVTFTEVNNGIRVDGLITGMPAGKYGFHIHETGDISTCDATGGHFDVDGSNHGGPDHEERHVGDFGNVVFEGNGTAVADFSFVDNVISFSGRNSIIGRGLVLHEQEDDLGLGGHETSLITGNAGPRVACGVIGIKSPADADAWANSGHITALSTIMLLSVMFVSNFIH